MSMSVPSFWSTEDEQICSGKEGKDIMLNVPYECFKREVQIIINLEGLSSMVLPQSEEEITFC